MNHWLANSAKNLLPLSKAQVFTEALREWYFSGEVDNHEGEDAEIVCQLCGHADLVHHFHIKNRLTQQSLLVGSSCILKFREIEVRDEHGRAIEDPQLRKTALDEALRDQIIETSLQPLRELWKQSPDIRNVIEFFAKAVKTDLGLDPDQLSDLIKLLERGQIQYSAKLYKVNMRSNDAKFSIANMSSASFNRIKPAFSRIQLEKAVALRNEA